ncbi:MAG: dihydrofolate reductase family protein [Bacteroidota bacterium]|nr:dihydrofolate reductase family protein [Bacteroidota bacterium]
MKTVLIFVSTLDGKVTKWGEPHVKKWASVEDQKYFKKIWIGSELVIMGSGTFDAEPITPLPNRLLLIMTRDPSKYRAYEIPGQLEFSDKSPFELTQQFQNKGYETMIVVGGAHIATSFLKEKLIDEVWLTIEPKIFGTGGSFVIEEKLDINLKLISCEKVNEQGTLITKYSVVKSA